MSKPPAKRASTPISRGTPVDYNNVIKKAQLRGVKLLSNAFELKPDALVGDPKDWAFALKSEMSDSDYSAESGHLRCIYHYAAACKNGRTRMLSAQASYIITFHVEGDCNGQSARAYAAILGRVAAYPYFRALFATVTNQAGLALPPLPIMSEQPRNVDAVLRSFGNPDDRGLEETR